MSFLNFNIKNPFKKNLKVKGLKGDVTMFDNAIRQWHHDRNLINGSTDKDQVLKLMQELGELSDSCCKGKDMRDDLGDMMVVMLNIMERNGYSLEGCLAQAYGDIKDRKGKMVDGIFVKEGDY
jgi:NTP pyrophosphatase (non-canonical NTP hydrolase)